MKNGRDVDGSLTGVRFAEIMNGVKTWKECSLEGCHCHGSEMLHVETPEGTMYGPRDIMEAILREMQSPVGRRPIPFGTHHK